MAQDRVEAVERALTILEAFDASQEAFTLAELANVTGFYKSTLLRLLGSLERHDYVKRGDDGRWQLGGSPARLARRHAPSQWLVTRLQPVLDQLTADTGETAALVVSQGDVAECRLAAMPDCALRHELKPGQRWSVASAASPCPDIPGGLMECRRLSDMPDHSIHWLTLSGPASRLTQALAARHLDAALQRLNADKEARP